jgi:hypothetical protein
VSGVLHRLVARTIGQANVVRPRPFPRFAGALDLPIDSPYVDSSAASNADGSAVERLDGMTILRGRTYAERERAGDTVPPAIERLPGQRRVEQPSPAAFLEERDASEISAREELRVDLEGISTYGDDATIGDENTRPPRSMPSVTAREDQRGEDTTQGFPAANRITARDRDTDPIRAADVTERRARTRRSRTFDPDDRVDVALLNEIVDPSPLAPMLAGPRMAREFEAIGSAAASDRARFDTAPEPEATIVNVTIGRIEVRSPAEPPSRTFRREAPAAPQPREQLDAYLRARSGLGR